MPTKYWYLINVTETLGFRKQQYRILWHQLREAKTQYVYLPVKWSCTKFEISIYAVVANVACTRLLVFVRFAAHAALNSIRHWIWHTTIPMLSILTQVIKNKPHRWSSRPKSKIANARMNGIKSAIRCSKHGNMIAINNRPIKNMPVERYRRAVSPMFHRF